MTVSSIPRLCRTVFTALYLVSHYRLGALVIASQHPLYEEDIVQLQSGNLSPLPIPELLNPSSINVAPGEQDWTAADVMEKHVKFTPEVMLAAPRRSGPTPNADGSLALYTVSTYSFESTVKTKEIRLFDMASRRSTLITNEEKASAPQWLEDDILYLREGDESGNTELIIGSTDIQAESYSAAVVPGSISSFKVKPLAPGKIAVVFAARTTREDELWNKSNETKRNHSGVVYDSTFVRHWDHYIDTTRNALWYGLFTREKPHESVSKGRWGLSTLRNALRDTDLESPISPFASSDDYDIGAEGLVFVAKDPDLNPAYHTKCNFYHVAVHDFEKQVSSKPRLVQAEGLSGAASGPVISPDGKMAVYLQMKEDGYEADRNRVLLVQDLTSEQPPIELFHSPGQVVWDRSPSKAIWSHVGRQLFFLAEDTGRLLVWHADLNAVVLDRQPRKLTYDGHVTDVIPLSRESLLLSGDNLIDNSVWSLLSLSSPGNPIPVTSNTQFGAAFGLSQSQVSEIWFKGAKGRDIHAWVIKPSSRSTNQKLPLAMAIHGGPQSAWADAWSTRWNPAVFAEQGYVVVAPNPTGSTSYGQELTDAIRDNWGGDPYEDLVACFDHIEKHMSSEVDVERAVALGASFGGYMINWIQGHDLGRRFKALVCHDGVFSTSSDVSQDEQYFPVHDHGGYFWDEPDKWAKWSPALHTANWSTPQLIIHSEKDYRLAMSEGLGPFNVLQGRGVPSRLLYFPDENHWVAKEENSRVWHTVVINWINQWVGYPAYANEEEVVGPPVGKKYKG